jgi:hypothetical protein
MLIPVGEPMENREWILRRLPCRVRRIGLIPLHLLPGKGADVLQHRRTRERISVLDDGELDLFRFAFGGFSPEMLHGDLPRDVVEGATGAMHDVADHHGRLAAIRGTEAFHEIGEVAPLLRVVLHTNAVTAGVVDDDGKKAIEITEMYPCALNLQAGVV